MTRPVYLGDGDHIGYDAARDRYTWSMRLTGGRTRTGVAPSPADALWEFRAWAWQRPAENRRPLKKRGDHP